MGKNNDLINFVANIKGIEKNINQHINQYMQDHGKELLIINHKIKKFLISVGEFVGDFINHSQKQKIINSNMSKDGWFPSSFTFRTDIKNGESNDNFMRRVIETHYDHIKEIFIVGYPHRSEIFKEMFECLESGKYRYFIIDCFTQIDGICTEGGYAPFFSQEHDKKNDKKGNPTLDKTIRYKKFASFLDDMIKNKKYDDFFLVYYKRVITHANESFIGQSTHKLDYNNPHSILNRHGILHGDIAHLKAGTELNALKALSLLLFVDFLIRGIETFKSGVEKNL